MLCLVTLHQVNMDNNYHKPGLYRWKRQEDSRVYSRSQNTKTKDDIQNWIKTVEEASNRAAEQVFGTGQYGGRAKGKAIARATKEYMKDDEQAYSEAQELLSQWMEEKVNLHSHLEPEIDCHYDDEDWQNHEIQLDVKREWDNLIANNYEEYGLPLSSRPDDNYKKDIYSFDPDDAVASVMKNMMDKQVVKKEFKKDLGLDKWAKQRDPKTKMELRQKQVKENREKREEELRKRREEHQRRKETMTRAKQLVMKEEQTKQAQAKREEMEIRKEMAKIRKEMQEERRRIDEQKAKSRQDKESTLLAATVKVAWDLEAEKQTELEEQRRQEEKQRLLAQRLRELEAREAANNLKILHRHFSAWYNVVLDRRLKAGKAMALYDWRLLLRAWNAWRGYVREQRMERESRQQQQEVISTHRNQQIAERHNRLSLLRKYFVAWQVWVKGEQDRRDLEQAQKNTRNKMMSLLEAAATGKLWTKDDQVAGDVQGSRKNTGRDPTHSARDRQKKSTADKISALFENSRHVTGNDTPLSTERSDVSGAIPSGPPQSRLPTEPWQVTRKHLELSPEEIAALGAGEPSCSPEEMNAKILKKYGRQPWHKKEVSSYEHRHATQRKILEEQKRQIMEQQRLIEDLQFKTTHVELQKQLVEQKLTLQNIAQQIEDKPNNTEKDDNSSEANKPATGNQPPKRVQAKPTATKPAASKPVGNQHTQSQSRQRSQSAVSTHKITEKGSETSRSIATTDRSTRPASARTDISRPSSYTSTASEKSKYLQVLKNMEERTAERARLKAEREERRRKAEEERLAQLEAIEEAKRKEEEEEKRQKAEQYRERKKLEKQREEERLIREEKLRQQNVMADQHYNRALLKYHGLLPMLKLVALARQQEERAEQHHRTALMRKVLLSWHGFVKSEWEEKIAMADQMNNFLCVKHCFQSWRLYKHHMVIEEHKAKKHFEHAMLTKVFQTWRDYANEEKVASWEKDRRAREHYRMLLMRRHFNAWQRLPEELKLEEERARRRAELREKVASILPDFEVSDSVDASVDFSL